MQRKNEIVLFSVSRGTFSLACYDCLGVLFEILFDFPRLRRVVSAVPFDTDLFSSSGVGAGWTDGP